MANLKKPTHVVTHPKMYLSVNGQLQHFEQGTEVVLNPAQAEKLGNKVQKIAAKKRVDLTGSDKPSGKSDKD